MLTYFPYFLTHSFLELGGPRTKFIEISESRNEWVILIQYYMSVCGLQRRIETQLREKLTSLVDMLDWVSQAEHGLGSEQPQNDQSTLLSGQVDTHKVTTQIQVVFY